MSIQDLDGKEINNFIHNWTNGLSAGFENSLVVERQDQGIGEAILLDEEIAERRGILVTARNKLQIKNLVDGLKRYEGRRVSFWFVDPVSHLGLHSDISDLSTNIVIKNNGYILDNRRIYIKKTDGNEITRKIQSYTVGENTTDIIVDQVPGVDLVDVYCANIMRLMRIDNDIPNLVFECPTVCQCSLSIIELVKEY